MDASAPADTSLLTSAKFSLRAPPNSNLLPFVPQLKGFIPLRPVRAIVADGDI